MKHEKFSGVSEQTLKIILQSGLAAVTFSRVAEAAGVSRGWLYKYVGKSQVDLVRTAALHFGSIAARLGEPTPAHDRESYLEHLVWALERLSRIASEHPWFIPLYHRYKGSPTPLGEVISQVEERLLAERIRDIQRCVPQPKVPATALAELILAVDLALAFRWQHSSPQTPARMEAFKATSRMAFDGIL